MIKTQTEKLVLKAKVMIMKITKKIKFKSNDKAIQLSPSQQNAYRFVLDYLNKKKILKNLIIIAIYSQCRQVVIKNI